MRALFVLLAMVGSAGVHAQAPTSPSFEVASVKPNKSGPQQPEAITIQPGDRVTIRNAPLRFIIQAAYGLNALQLVDGPGPTSPDRFDIFAKAEAPVSADQLRLMLRALLAERFKLVVHTETRPATTYALVIARRDGKLGPNLHAARIDCATLRSQAAQPGERSPCGLAGGLNRMTVRGMGLDTLSARLTVEAGSAVVDQTGLNGAFDWDLTWTPQAFLLGSFNRERFPSIDPDGSSIFVAVQEQLGLKLESQQGSIDVVVVDHFEQPTED